MGKIKFVFLDLDNTLCQSERLAYETCTELTNKILREHEIDEEYSVDSLLNEFVGHNFQKMLVSLQKKYGFQMSSEEQEKYTRLELEGTNDRLSDRCVECPGATQQLEWLQSNGYEIGVVTTSARSRVDAALTKTGQLRFFKDEHIFCAASLDPPSSKPEPTVYLHACNTLGVQPHECVTVEDSETGATSAMRADMPCIAYVGIYGVESGRNKMSEMSEALVTKCGAKTTMYDWAEFPECMKKMETN